MATIAFGAVGASAAETTNETKVVKYEPNSYSRESV